MARITIDGKEYEVRDGDNLLAAALEHGLDLPYFCWHPALGSVGACRQCAVKQYKDAEDTRGRLVMACMAPVSDGARFTIDDKESREFRRSVIEWLMLNHPHDCPVCDEGGECHLQDMTVMTGHIYRRSNFPKRTYRSQNLGPFVTHEMNRCIACYRCVRFYNDYAGGEDLHALASKNHVYFGRHADGALESPFSGNLVEVCPTGVFTDKTLAQHYTRKWDLQSAPTVCVHCGLGCNTFAAERYGTLRRITNRYHSEINGYFLCDRGRFGYQFVNSDDRLRLPALRTNRRDELQTSESEALLQHLAAATAGKRLIGIGSPRASMESNYALRKLVGALHFFSGLAEREQRMAELSVEILRRVRGWSLREVESCDAVVILGEEIESTNPRLSLAIRQSVRHRAFHRADELEIPRWQDISVREAAPNHGSPLFILSPLPTVLDAIATRALRLLPEEIVATAQEIVNRLRGTDASPSQGDEREAIASEIAKALRGARRVAVIGGAIQGDESILASACQLVQALEVAGIDAGIVITAAECNTMGIAMLRGKPLEQLPTGEDVAYLIMHNDISRRLPDETIKQQLANSGAVIVIDSVASDTSERADVTLPATTFAQETGLYINNESRAQRSYQVFPAPPHVRAAWEWIGDIGECLGRGAGFSTAKEILTELSEEFSEFRAAVEALPSCDEPWRVARQSHRFSGRTAMSTDKTVHEPPPPADHETPLRFSMEGYGAAPASLATRYWAPGWNSYQAVNFYQREIGGSLRGGDPGVRLLQPKRDHEPLSALVAPSASGRWIAVPFHQIFGSEELSARGSAIASRMEPPCALLNPEDAKELALAEGDLLEIGIASVRHTLPVKLLNIARGAVAIPSGFGPFLGIGLPAQARVRRGG